MGLFGYWRIIELTISSFFDYIRDMSEVKFMDWFPQYKSKISAYYNMEDTLGKLRAGLSVKEKGDRKIMMRKVLDLPTPPLRKNKKV